MPITGHGTQEETAGLRRVGRQGLIRGAVKIALAQLAAYLSYRVVAAFAEAAQQTLGG